MQEADKAAVLALAYRLTHHHPYFKKARDILLTWATINKPTGNPIDETRLEGLIWGYDLIACELSPKDRKIIKKWFYHLYTQKKRWQFGPLTAINNHHIHQIKMMLLLTKILKSEDWQININKAIKYSKINLDSLSGQSIDYKTRTSLYYHNYDLQAWLEIQLITGKVFPSVLKAFDFLKMRLFSSETEKEFMHSKAKIDALREKGGFIYAKKGGVFDSSHSAPTIISFYTQQGTAPPSNLSQIVNGAKPSPWIAFLKARQQLWKR